MSNPPTTVPASSAPELTTESILREKRDTQVKTETSLLWEQVKTLLDSDHTEAGLLLCRIRLTDPHAHIPTPVTGTPDELRVIGNSMHGLALYKLHVAPDAPYPDSQMNHEVVLAYKHAAEGAVRYYSRHSWQINHFLHDLSLALSRQGDQAASVADYERLIELHKEVLKRKEVDDMTRQSKERDVYKTHLLMLIVSLQRLEKSYVEAERRVDAFRILDEAALLLENYIEQSGPDADVNRNRLAILVSMSKLLEDTASTDDETASALSYLKKCRKIMEEGRAEHGDDIYRDANHAKLEDMYAVAIGTIGGCLSSDPDENGGVSANSLLLEGSDICRRLCRVPEDLEEGFPPDFAAPYGDNYVRMLRALGPTFDCASQTLATLERALRVYFVKVTFQPTDNKIPVPPYHDLVNDADWKSFRFEQIELVLSILDKISHARAGWILRMREEDGPAPSGSMELLNKEANLTVRLAEALGPLADTPNDSANALIEKASALIMIGKVKVYQDAEQNDWIEIRRIWKQALEILQNFSSSGITERRRLNTIATIKELLLRSQKYDPEVIRNNKVRRESDTLWDPVGQLTREGRYEEALAMCRERLADPLAFLPEPVVATVDELKVCGYHDESSILSRLCEDNKDHPRFRQMLEAYQNASHGYRVYFPLQKGLRSKVLGYYAKALHQDGQIAECLATYKESIRLAKEVSLPCDEDEISPGAASYDKGIKLSLIASMRSLATISEDLDRNSGLDVMEGAWHVTQDYISMYGLDHDIQVAKAEVLADKACSLYLSNRLEEALATCEESVKEYQTLAEKDREEGKEDEERIRKFNDGCVCGFLNIICWSKNSRRTTFRGMTLTEIRSEVVKLCRWNTGLPEDIDAPRPPDLKLDHMYLYKYVEALYYSAQDIAAEEDRISVLQKAFRISDLRLQCLSKSSSLLTRSYNDILVEPLLSEADVPTLKDVIRILRAIIEVRVSHMKEKSATFSTMEPSVAPFDAEVALALSLTDVAIAKASKPVAQIQLLEQVTLLILKGKALQVRKMEGAKEVWMKAKDVLDNLSEAGVTSVEWKKKIEEVCRLLADSFEP